MFKTKYGITSSAVSLVGFVLFNDLPTSFLIVEGEQDLIETRITLAVIHEIDKLHAPDCIRFTLRSVETPEENIIINELLVKEMGKRD